MLWKGQILNFRLSMNALALHYRLKATATATKCGRNRTESIEFIYRYGTFLFVYLFVPGLFPVARFFDFLKNLSWVLYYELAIFEHYILFNGTVFGLSHIE